MDVVIKPALWGTLPMELLCLVFARLPVSRISQLRLLSNNWKREIETSDSEFSQVLEKTVYPSIFGLICWKERLEGTFFGRVFDVKSDRWHDFLVDAADTDEMIPVGAADGGLVCFVSETTHDPMFVIVMNPLTVKKVQLPCLLGMDAVRHTVQPTMVQLIMDSQKQHYKVFAAGYVKSCWRLPFAQVYDSRTKGWTVVGSGQQSWGRIHGTEFDWEHEGDFLNAMRWGPCVYDFAEGRLQDFGWRSRYVEGIVVKGSIVEGSFIVLKNRLFVLHKQAHADPANLVPANDSGLLSNNCISEYHLQKNAHSWVKVETHDCSPFNEYCSEKALEVIFACNRFLLVIHYIEGGWLYDLSTHEWRKLPKLQDHAYNGSVELMCELRWDAVP